MGLTVDRNRPEVLAERILVAFQAKCGDVWIVIGSGRDGGGLFALWLNIAFVVVLVQAYREQTRNLAQIFVSKQNANVQITNRIARQDCESTPATHRSTYRAASSCGVVSSAFVCGLLQVYHDASLLSLDNQNDEHCPNKIYLATCWSS